MTKKTKTALVATLLLLVCAIALGGAVAFYSSAVQGETQTLVAAFAFNASVEPEAVSVTAALPGEVKIGTLHVSNEESGRVCEVTTKYTIILDTDMSLASGTYLELRNGSAIYSPSEIDGTSFVYEDTDFVYTPGEKSADSYEVYLCWDQSYNTTVDIAVTAKVIGEQMD